MFIVNPYIYATPGYLLDTYSAAAAYSLRQLKTGVTNVVRVRRSSDSAESDFTATEITDGTLTTWTGANDGFVVKWYNQGTATSADIDQTSATLQPKLVSAGTVITRGSLPAVEFDGTYVSNYRRLVQKRNLIVQNTSATNYFGDLSTGRDVSDVRLLSSFVDSSKNMSAFDNGAAGGTDTYTGSFNQDVIQLGTLKTNFYINHLNGTIQEAIIFTNDESANRTAIESDINTHYSIY
jgi:hypothetical protein